MKNTLLIILIGLAVCGCGTVYESRRSELLKTATEADYGAKPPSGYQETEKTLILNSLKDPESARLIPDSDVVPFIMQKGFASPTPVLVWAHTVRVNAKNGFGGYVGFKLYQFAWKDGRLFAHFTEENGFWIYD